MQCNGCDEIIGFGVIRFHDIPTESPDHVPQMGDLCQQIFRSGRAVCFVIGGKFQPVGRFAFIEDECTFCAGEHFFQFQEEAHHPENGICGVSVFIGKGTDGIVAAEDLSERIHEDDRLSVFCHSGNSGNIIVFFVSSPFNMPLKYKSASIFVRTLQKKRKKTGKNEKGGV